MESGKIEWRGGLEESVVEGVVVWGCAGAHNGPWSICFRAVPWHSAQCGVGGGKVTAILSFPSLR